MASNKVSEKKEDFNSALLVVQNIIEGEKIERFKFTNKEKSALLFVSDLLEAHIIELQHL
jgi:hypothetical protein